MKTIIFTFMIAFATIGCKSQENKNKSVAGYDSFGAAITANNTANQQDMIKNYDNLKVGDTLNVKFKSTINAVCQNKGCWMKVALADNKDTFVKFKDYAFFMPKDSKGREVIVNGKAYVSEESIADQKHYAGDAGKSQAEIDKITTTKKTLSFMADGVLIKQ